MPSTFVLCGRHGRKRVLAKCGKGSLLRGVEPVERAIGRVHSRRLLLRWQAKRADGRGVLLGRSAERPLQRP